MVFKVNVNWYDNSDEKEKKDGLFLMAESYVNAIEKLVNYYGEEDMWGIQIELWAPEDFIILDRGNPAEDSLFDTIDKDIGKNIIW